MLSARDQRRRELVKVLEELHHAYGVQLHITGDIPDDASKRAFKRLSLKVHPDRGSKTEDQERLNDAYRAWNDASKHAHPAGRPQETSATRPERYRTKSCIG